MTTQLPGSGAILGGDFRIERQLGAGGMGAVYVAEQLSTGRRRALKLMHPSLVSDTKLRERFEQEARVGARIPSDHVVQVIAAGVDEATGAPFIAMELLDGEDLSATMNKRGALPPSDIRAILQPVCHALAAAHAAGIVHRDLKPENIFLLHTQGVQRSFDVKLLDFGIAKLTADARTMATSAVGTPLWMAPEQTDPRAKIAPTADVWPLGLLVFSMLTGQSYWRVASDPSVSVQALMREILFEPIDAPSVRAVELGIDVLLPLGFDAWFSMCVDRDVARRFSTAKEAWDALVPVLGAEVKPPAQLAALVKAGSGATDRRRLELDATAPVGASQVETAATMPVSGLSGMDATVDASALAAVAVSGHATGLSVGHTVPGAAAPARSNVRTFGAIAVAALIGIGSWQLATSRAERQHLARQEATQEARQEAAEAREEAREENAIAPSSSRETLTPPSTNSVGLGMNSVATPASSASVAAAAVVPDAPLSRSAAVAAPPKPAPPPTPKLEGFNSVEAQRSMEFLARTVKHHCARLPGPRAFGVTVTFGPSGRAIKAKTNTFIAAPTGTCVENILFGAYVSPFDPASGNGIAAIAISLD